MAELSNVPQQVIDHPTHRVPPSGRLTANLAIVIVAALFLGLVGVMWCYSWWRVPAQPSALFEVHGSQEFAGTEITIEGASLPGPRREVIGEDNAYTCQFRLPAGEYAIQIQKGGHVLFKTPMFKLAEHQYAVVPLSKLRGAKDLTHQP